MSKDSITLWKAARKNIPGLPDCPDILAEPRYAAVVFDQYCFVSAFLNSPEWLALILLFRLVALLVHLAPTMRLLSGSARLAIRLSKPSYDLSLFTAHLPPLLSIRKGKQVEDSIVPLSIKTKIWSMVVCTSSRSK